MSTANSHQQSANSRGSDLMATVNSRQLDRLMRAALSYAQRHAQPGEPAGVTLAEASLIVSDTLLARLDRRADRLHSILMAD